METKPSSKGLTIGLALLLGLVMASVHQTLGDLLTGAMLGALLAQVVVLRKRASNLGAELRQLRGQHAPEPAAPARAASMPAAGVGQPAPSQTITRPSGVVGATGTHERFASGAPPGATSTPAPASAPARPQGATARPRAVLAFERAAGEVMDWLKRGNPLARAGIVILFFGASFLAKYAADQSLFPIELRFIVLALGAFAMLFIGWRLREMRSVYAEVLQGGGVAGLYLTVFAATMLYDLLPLGLAFGLMVAIALAAAVLAVAQNALSLAVIGEAGGFLAPILVSTGSGDHVALFSYYAVLNLGVFAIAWFRSWRVLNVLGFAFTFGITGLWRVSGYEQHELLSADAFLILFLLMYVGVSVLNCIRQPPNLKGYLSGSLVFGLPVVAFTLHASLVAKIEYALAWSAFALSAFYLALGWVLFTTRRENFRLLVEAFGALGVIFASLAIPLAFDTRTTAAMWAVEGAGLLWLGVRQQRKLARAFGALLQLGAGLGYLADLPVQHGDHPALDTAYLGAVMVAASGLFSGYWLHRNRDRAASYERGASVAFSIWALAWWSYGGLNEIALFLPDYALGTALAFAAATAALLAWLSARLQWRLPRTMATYLPALAALAGLVNAASLGHPFAQWGAAGWLLLVAVHLMLLRIGETEPVPGRDWLHGGLCWLLALGVAWESGWQIAERTAGVWSSLPWGLAPAMIVAWCGRRVLWPAWPLEQHADAYRVIGAVPLVIATALWIAIMNVTSRGDAGWLPYVPLLNPLDVSVALCFAAVGLWWTSLHARRRAALWRADRRLLIGMVAGLVFLWLNAALLRSLHHNFGAPITLPGMARSTLVQSALSIFWGVLGFAAMTVSARRRWRYAWIAGAGLMGVVVAKLFLVDLSSVGTIARIASFLSVGALLLITGYLAPLPPRRDLVQA